MSTARTTGLALLALALITLLAGCAAAPGSLLLVDETSSLDRAGVEAAAAPLLARGARVAVLVVVRGDETGEDLTRRLGEAGLLEAGQIAPAALALYVSYEPRYSELRAGTNWSKSLPDAALREARTGVLNPALRTERPAAGVAATLQALEARIASPPLLQRVVEGFVYLVLAGFAVAAVAISPLGEGIVRWWRRSPPGRLARWLGAQTPPGRRRLERILRTTRIRLEDRADYARSMCRAAVAGPQRAEAAPLMARLQLLDQRRAALAADARPSYALEEAMDKLAWEYMALGSEASRLAPARTEPKRKRSKGAAGAATGAGFAASDSASATSSPSSSDSSPGWDSGPSGDSGPSSDGGSW